MGCNDNTALSRTGTSGGSARAMMGGMGLTRVMTVMDEAPVQTTTAAAAATWDEYVLTDESFETQGPAITDIIAHAQASNSTTHFEYQVVIQYKYKSAGWATSATELVGPFTNDTTYRIGTAFNDRTEFGIRIRIVLQVRVATGGTGSHRANMNVALAVRYYNG